MTDLKGQIALVTGASRGLGRAIALELGAQRATVVGTATSAAGAADILRVGPHGGRDPTAGSAGVRGGDAQEGASEAAQ